MDQYLLLGNEAVALGAIDAGISGVYAYPGTPSTEITEYIQRSEEASQLTIRSSWSANEKTAYEAALGMAYAGKRSMVCMKHVGLNVAADPFMNSAVSGVNGGLVLVVADDPGMHSSQNEQDSRMFARFAMIPVLEPSSQQEAYDCVADAFGLSEKMDIPVMIRLTTRISHSRSGIKRREIKKSQNKLDVYNADKKFILLPVNARKQYKNLIDKQNELQDLASKSTLNYVVEGEDKSIGIIACGIAFNYVMEVKQSYNLNYPVLKIGQYPFPKKMVSTFLNELGSVLVVEEGFPVYEEFLRGFFDNNIPIDGRLNSKLPRTGELDPLLVANALGVNKKTDHKLNPLMKMRPPMLCKGCGHRDVFLAVNEVLNGLEEHVFSDIGCYTLGALPPFNAINTCIDMGASVTMAKGAADAGLHPSVAVIGDSTFTHSGMTGLLDAVNDKTPVTIIISDNSTTGMTGGQKSSGEGKYALICKALGVEEQHIKTIIPLKKNHEENVALLSEEFNYRGVSVIIAQRECIQALAKKKKKQKS